MIAPWVGLALTGLALVYTAGIIGVILQFAGIAEERRRLLAAAKELQAVAAAEATQTRLMLELIEQLRLRVRQLEKPHES